MAFSTETMKRKSRPGSGRLRRILLAPPDGTRTSSAERAPHPRERLVAGNRLDQPLTNFIATPLRRGGPELIDSVGLGSIEAFHETVSQKGACLARQSKRLHRNLLNSHRHGIRILRFVGMVKTRFSQFLKGRRLARNNLQTASGTGLSSIGPATEETPSRVACGGLLGGVVNPQ